MKLRVARKVVARTHNGEFPFPILGRRATYWRARQVIARADRRGER